MNTINTATGYSPFQLRLGFSPWLISPIVSLPRGDNPGNSDVSSFIEQLNNDIRDAQDSLITTNI